MYEKLHRRKKKFLFFFSFSIFLFPYLEHCYVDWQFEVLFVCVCLEKFNFLLLLCLTKNLDRKKSASFFKKNSCHEHKCVISKVNAFYQLT